jgi:hypothetical protein
MALTSATTSWQNVTLTHNEVWMVRKGTVNFHSGSVPNDQEEYGVVVETGDSIKFSSGLTVYYKTAFGSGDHAFARIHV